MRMTATVLTGCDRQAAARRRLHGLSVLEIFTKVAGALFALGAAALAPT